jgi:phospholipid/cholesterol/gamma-HCH transport system substrate-binding protein
MSKEMKVGLFFVIGMLILGGLTFYAGGLDDWIKKRYTIRGYFDKVDGLEEEDRVTLAGVEVGEVRGMRVTEGRVEVVMAIDRDALLREDSVARIESESLLGGKYINVTVGSPQSARLEDGDTIRTEEAADLTRMLQNVADVAEDVRVFVRNFNENQEQLIGDLQDILGENRENIRTTFESLSRITTENEEDLRKIIASLRDAAPQLEQTTESINKIAQRIERGEGTIGKLVQDENLYNDLRDLSASLREASGTMTRILGDNEEDIRATIVSLREAAPKIEATLTRVDSITEKIEKGEGTIGKLVQDDTLYKEATRMFKESRHAAEDVREQVPIITFTSVLFAAFQ